MRLIVFFCQGVKSARSQVDSSLDQPCFQFALSITMGTFIIILGNHPL